MQNTMSLVLGGIPWQAALKACSVTLRPSRVLKQAILSTNHPFVGITFFILYRTCFW